MRMRKLLVCLVSATALAIGFTTLAAAQSSAAMAIYDASAVVSTNVKGVHTFKAPAAGFNPLTASDEELATYGFPPRPPQDDVEHYGMWAKAMRAGKTQWAGELKVMPYSSVSARPANAPEGVDEVSAAKEAAGPVLGYYYNWSGFINTQPTLKKYNTTSTTSSFYYIVSDFNVPVAEEAFNSTPPPSTICDNSTDLEVSWNGIDGDLDGAALLQGGTLSGITCSEPYTGYFITSTQYLAWLEWYPAYSILGAFNVNPGDDFYVETWDTTATQGYVFLDDETLGIYGTFAITSGGGPGLIGNSAEYIVERPCCIGSDFFPLANYVQNFWANSFAVTFYEYNHGLATPWYPGSTSTNNVLATMVNDEDTYNISVPKAMGDYGIFFEDENCAYSGGCVP
jgi:hypothetical protein